MVFCPYCGAEIETKEKFCPFCGYKLEEPIVETDEKEKTIEELKQKVKILEKQVSSSSQVEVAKLRSEIEQLRKQESTNYIQRPQYVQKTQKRKTKSSSGQCCWCFCCFFIIVIIIVIIVAF